jgi:microcystin-dependent protein
MDPKRDVGDKFVTCAPTAPFGTILAQGQELSRAQYSRLFARIGTAFGAGDGSTTFNAPNAKGRTIFGLDTGNTAFDTRGEVGGSQTHTLLEAEIAGHVHDMGHGHSASAYDAGHSHDMGHGHGRNYGATYGGAGNHLHAENIVDSYDGNNGGLQRKYRPAGAVSWPTTGAGAHDHSMFVDFGWLAQGTGGEGAHAHTPTIAARVGDTGAKGGGAAHNNMPPFLVEHWCVQV